MDRVKVLNVLNALHHSLAHDPDYMDLSGCAPELKWLINDYNKLIAQEVVAREEYQTEVRKHTESKSEHLKTKVAYAQTARKLKRFKDRMTQIREIAGRENPSIKDIRYLANGYEMREGK